MISRCVSCAAVQSPDGFHPVCSTCDQMVEVEYDLANVSLAQSTNPYDRFFELLPVTDRSLLPAESASTPTVHAEKLGAAIGLPWLYLKDESVLPTYSTKDRMASVALAFLWESGVRGFCTSSTGNSSTAYAHGLARYDGQRMFIFTAENWIDRLDLGASPNVVSIALRDATFVEAYRAAAVFAKQQRLVPERGFFNPGRREGLKLAFFEATDQVPRPIDWYVQAISSGMGVHGTIKGARELQALGHIDRVPSALCVQQQSCSPMVDAYEDGSPTIRPEHVVPVPTGIAPAILRGDPTLAYPYMRKVVDDTGGAFVAVSEDEIREARRLAEDCEGLSPCFSAATALAGVIRQARKGTFDRDTTVLVNLTGGDRPSSDAAGRSHWMVRGADGWQAEDPATEPQWRSDTRLQEVPDGD